MCGSDSGADTRDSENGFPASLADGRERGRAGKVNRDRKPEQCGKERGGGSSRRDEESGKES